MKLITNFRDYYDGVARRDRDPSPIWIRNKITDCDDQYPNYGIEWKVCIKEQTVLAPPSRHLFVIGFAGKLYPCYRGECYYPNYKSYADNELSPRINYDPDSFSKTYNSWLKKWEVNLEVVAYLEKIRGDKAVDKLFQWFGGQFLLEGGNKWLPSRWCVPGLS